MIGRIPALLHSATAAADSSLGGSIMATSPRNIRWSSSWSVSSISSDTTLYAKASTRSPSSEYFRFCASILARSSLVISYTSSPNWIRSVLSSSTSTAPFTIIVGIPFNICLVAISFRSLSNGFSLSLGYFFRTSSGSIPSPLARFKSAVSVGSPISIPSALVASLQRILLIIRRLCELSVRSTAPAGILFSST